MLYVSDLKKLLDYWKISIPIIRITDVTLDSRSVSSGSLFIAISGCYTDGRNYIVDAINRGASAIIAESTENMYHTEYISYIGDIPVIYLKNLRDYVSFISGQFYKHPSRFLDVIGVTGTNGKTTVSHLLFQWIHLLCGQTAVISSIGNGMFNDLSPSVSTTPSAVEVQRVLAMFLHKGVTFVSMEVSSHALVQKRIHDLYFQAAVFTNLSHDHLDYHGDMLSYELAKWKLFSELKVKEYIINADDSIGAQWLLKLSCGTAVVWNRKLPCNWKGQWLRVVSLCNCHSGYDIVFDSTWGRGLLHSNLIGRYNVINLLLALATLLTLNYPLSDLLKQASHLQSICGRMEVFKILDFPTIIVDYAHTPDALERILREIRLRCVGKIWCVFGCGGNRDSMKRPIMGRIAEKYSDNVIITDDNPRFEDSKDIINDIKSGISHKIQSSKYFKIIQKREEALNYVISQANQDDWILVAGKGHEDYQIIGCKKILYSDQFVIKKILGIEI